MEKGWRYRLSYNEAPMATKWHAYGESNGHVIVSQDGGLAEVYAV